MAELLPPNALAGRCFGISVSESHDLARLGLTELHFRLAVGEIARCVLVSGGNIAYGGHLAPDGYTAFLTKELQKYGRRDRPLLVCLAWQEHRRMTLTALEASRTDLGLFGQIVCLDSAGNEVDPGAGRDEQPQAIDDPALRKQSLTALRRYMVGRTHGRILIGGRRHGFQGEIPGLIEEALVSLVAGQPLYLAGGFGGVTADAAVALGVNDGAWLVKRDDAPPNDPRLVLGVEQLKAIASASTWAGLRNGLSDEENRRLAASHRPSEIAALVSLGLGRLNVAAGDHHEN